MPMQWAENDACAKALRVDIISMDEGFAGRDHDRHRTNAFNVVKVATAGCYFHWLILPRLRLQ